MKPRRSDDHRESGRRPAEDSTCPECGGSAHALDVVKQELFGGKAFVPKGARKTLDRAWDESDRMAREIDSTYAYLRSVIENCKTQDAAAIRHQLVGLLPEVQGASAEVRETFPALAKLTDDRARAAWAEYGYPEEGR